MTGSQFDVAFPEGLPIAGVVLADQVRTLDWEVRRAEVATVAQPDAVTDALGNPGTLLT